MVLTQEHSAFKLSNQIPMKPEIRKRDSLSPILFNSIMYEFINEAKQEDIEQEKRYENNYVNDHEHENSLQWLLYKFEQTAKTFKMRK